jgi:PIN domain nuclease of toxin-antitoxin system
MKLLWDTHTYLWLSSGSGELSEKIKKLIANDDTENYISIVSLWEITIKTGLGKLTINGNMTDVWNDISENGISVLPLEFKHLKLYENLPLHHRDPFDRIIASKAISENMNLLSRDIVFDQYFQLGNVKRIW